MAEERLKSYIDQKFNKHSQFKISKSTNVNDYSFSDSESIELTESDSAYKEEDIKSDIETPSVSDDSIFK